MRIAFAIFALLAFGTLSDKAQADPYPWCAEYNGGGLGGASNCYFMTLSQCQQTIAGVGGTCSQNPFYTGPPINQQQQQQQQQPQNQQQRGWGLFQQRY